MDGVRLESLTYWLARIRFETKTARAEVLRPRLCYEKNGILPWVLASYRRWPVVI
jgi:hypothetical protein